LRYWFTKIDLQAEEGSGQKPIKITIYPHIFSLSAIDLLTKNNRLRQPDIALSRDLKAVVQTYRQFHSGYNFERHPQNQLG